MKDDKEFYEKLDPNENYDIGFLLKVVSDKLTKIVNQFFKHDELTFSQGRVLRFISIQKNHETTQKEIETYLKVSHPAINGIINRLEEKELVQSEISVNRRLTKTVKLTKKGIQRHKAAEANRIKHEKMLTQKLTDKERETLVKLLIKVDDSLTDAEFAQSKKD